MMKPKSEDKLDLNLNPITGLPNEGKRYYYKYGSKADDNNDDEEAAEIDETKVKMLLERIRWRGARKVRGYRYSGPPIAEPKWGTDYQPWLRDE